MNRVSVKNTIKEEKCKVWLTDLINHQNEWDARYICSYA